MKTPHTYAYVENANTFHYVIIGPDDHKVAETRHVFLGNKEEEDADLLKEANSIARALTWHSELVELLDEAREYVADAKWKATDAENSMRSSGVHGAARRADDIAHRKQIHAKLEERIKTVIWEANK